MHEFRKIGHHTKIFFKPGISFLQAKDDASVSVNFARTANDTSRAKSMPPIRLSICTFLKRLHLMSPYCACGLSGRSCFDDSNPPPAVMPQE
jgi:hypothetical protein